MKLFWRSIIYPIPFECIEECELSEPKAPVRVEGDEECRCSFPMISNMAWPICDLGCLDRRGECTDGPRKRIFGKILKQRSYNFWGALYLWVIWRSALPAAAVPPPVSQPNKTSSDMPRVVLGWIINQWVDSSARSTPRSSSTLL